MSERPTPHIAIRRCIEPLPGVNAARVAEYVEENLTRHGYVIVHPDDVPEMAMTDTLYLDAPYGVGYNACRTRIFGEDA